MNMCHVSKTIGISQQDRSSSKLADFGIVNNKTKVSGQNMSESVKPAKSVGL